MGDAVAQPLRVDGAIFDMDGLLLDTERLAARGLANAAVDMAVDAPESFHHAMIGVSADRCRGLVQERFGPDFPADAYLVAASRHVDRLVKAGQPRLKVPEFIAPQNGAEKQDCEHNAAPRRSPTRMMMPRAAIRPSELLAPRPSA